MREELVARTMCVSWEVDGDGADEGEWRNAASMISSLKPTSWRETVEDDSEWYKIFWSACMEMTVFASAMYL